MPYYLEIERQPRGDGTREVAGLPIVLRLALDAQRGGAACVVAPPELAEALSDPRLTVPVLGDRPADEGARALVVPEHLVIHRDAFRAYADDPSGFDPLRDIAGGSWGFAPIAVTDRASARRAERALLRSLRKPQDGWTARHLNRHVSLSLTRWLVKTPLSPNQVSVGILGVGAVGAFMASQGDYVSQLVGAALFQTQSILDGCDGEMSRLTHRGSLAGEWLDTIGDDLTNYGFFAGAAWGLFVRSGSSLYLVAGAVTVVAGALASGIEYRYLIRIGSGDLLKHPASQTKDTGGVMAAIAPLFKRDTFVLLTLVAAALDFLGPMLVVFAAGALGVLANVIAAEVAMRREAT